MAFPNQLLEDEIIRNNYNKLSANYISRNQDMFFENIYMPYYYKCTKEFDNENVLRLPVVNKSCDKNVLYYRGENNRPPRNIQKQKTDFLLHHCDCNTYDNSLICNKTKCCSKSHQLFENHTKRNGFRLCNEFMPVLNQRSDSELCNCRCLGK